MNNILKNFYSSSNIVWLEKYLKQNKWLLELLAIFFAAQAFLYSVAEPPSNTLFNLKSELLPPLRVIFQVLIFVVVVLLFVKSDIEFLGIESKKKISKSNHLKIFEAFFAKALIRTSMSTLAVVNWVLMGNQLASHWNNFYIMMFLLSLGVFVLLYIFHLVVITIRSFLSFLQRR